MAYADGDINSARNRGKTLEVEIFASAWLGHPTPIPQPLPDRFSRAVKRLRASTDRDSGRRPPCARRAHGDPDARLPVTGRPSEVLNPRRARDRDRIQIRNGADSVSRNVRMKSAWRQNCVRYMPSLWTARRTPFADASRRRPTPRAHRTQPGERVLAHRPTAASPTGACRSNCGASLAILHGSAN